MCLPLMQLSLNKKVSIPGGKKVMTQIHKNLIEWNVFRKFCELGKNPPPPEKAPEEIEQG